MADRGPADGATEPEAATEPAAASAAAPAATPCRRGSVAGTGRVLTREGWPVPGASVTLLGDDGTQVGRAVSATDGGLRLPDVRPGAATLVVAAPGHDPSARPVVVPSTPVWLLGDLVLQRQGAAERPPAGVWVLDVEHSTVAATAHHLGLASVHGRFTSFSGVIVVPEHDVTGSTVEVSIDAASIGTGNAQRDAHLRSSDVLDAAAHPALRFASTGVRRREDARTWTLDGELTMAGITRPVQLALAYNGCGPDPWGGTRAAFSATTELHRDESRMSWNQAVAVGVSLFGTTVKVSIDVEAVLQT